MPTPSELMQRIEDLSTREIRDRLAEHAARVVAAEAETLFAEYPEARSESNRALKPFYTRTRKDGTQYKSKFKTMKQQAWFFANFRAGTIDLPRSRTGFLGASGNSSVRVTDQGVWIAIGSNLEYAPWVIGPQQSFYHAQTGWVMLDDALSSESMYLTDLFVETLQDLWYDYLERGYLP